VVSPDNGYVFHNRLTHSLKVAQIARRLAERCLREQPEESQALGGIDPDAAEAAGLAHDLGHPPFGHIAEHELDGLVRGAGLSDGFEGNAQSFRIATRLATSDARAIDERGSPIPGLNLTAFTLNGILKYPWGHAHNATKWGFYDSEREIAAWARKGSPANRRSVTAEIMDWADDITFAIHDLIDFYIAGQVPIDRCKPQKSLERERLLTGIFRRKPAWLRHRQAYTEALDGIILYFPFEPHARYTDSPDDRAALFAFASTLIGAFVESFRLKPGGATSDIEIDSESRCMVEVLKQFIWEYVIDNRDLADLQGGQRLAIRTVFSRLLTAATGGQTHLFPPSFRNQAEACKDKEAKIRLVSDCISSMTEREVMRFYRRLNGLAD
jgi:dGTPase